jgi:protein-ribulosamine 3-kinase
MTIPEEVQQEVRIRLKGSNGGVEITNFTAASGGCINNGGRLSTSTGDYFLKWNSATRFPGMFKMEADGLKILADARAIKIPEVIAFGEGENYSWILMEYIDSSARKSTYWQELGRQLAALHHKSAHAYGLDHNNYIGSLPQDNSYLDNWVEFLISRRYEPMVERALNSGKMGKEDARNFEKLYGKLKNLLVHEPPSLIHGDLWSGNLMTDGKGSPALIDPAVYYANREKELAYTTLFGGFDAQFYQSYQEEWPLEGGYHDRFEVYNLYPLMVHVNLFGGSYLSQVKNILKRYV